MQNELKPCPFCGGEGTLSTSELPGLSSDMSFYVGCDTCECSTSYEDTDDEAIKKWNTRQPVDNWKPIEELSRLSLTGVSTILLYSAERDFNIHDVCFVTDGTVLFVDNILGLYEVLETYTHYALLTPPERN